MMLKRTVGSSSASGRSCYNEIAVIMILLWHATAAAAGPHRVPHLSYASEPCNSQMVCLNDVPNRHVKITSIFTHTNSIKRLHCSLSLLSGICPFSQDGVIRSSSKSAGCVGRRQEAQGAHTPDTLLSCSFWDSETVHGIRGMWDGP